MQRRRTPASLLEANALAQDLLERAEQLVSWLEASCGRGSLHVVNVCGRQRMLSQKLAKEALLQALPDAAETTPRTPAGQLEHQFEDALVELEEAPLSSAPIRQALRTVREEWLGLLHGMRDWQKPASQLAIARSSEALLALLESLTLSYEHSLQLLMS